MEKAAYMKTFFDSMVLPYRCQENTTVEKGKWYVVNTRFGEDIAYSMSGITEISLEILHRYFHKHENHVPQTQQVEGIEVDDKSILETRQEHAPIEIENLFVVREATSQEVSDWQALRKEAEEAYTLALKEIRDLQLDMKLINVHFLMGRKKVIFNFTSDNRVDFRQLVKRLAALFRTRIEMRQIGVRDAAKIEGGCGICGIELCCTRSNCHMSSIYLRMAKDQGFLVNSSKLTGVCGRLLCCLAYEVDFYQQEKGFYPDLGSRVRVGNLAYRVMSVNLLRKEVVIVDENHHMRKVAPHELKKMTDKEGVYYQLVVEPGEDMKR
ncbi:MAG: stage 0 sporulation family protein [Brevinematales bacterium]